MNVQLDNISARLTWVQSQSAQLHAELEGRVETETARLRAEWRKECERAELLQRSLLLAQSKPHLPGLSVGSAFRVCQPDALIGGDFADIVRLENDQVALVLGDICGKGLVAALCVPQTLYALRLILAECPQPEKALGRLNRYLTSSDLPASCTFVALTLAVIDMQTNCVTCACAGSEPPLLLRASESVEVVNTCNVALGIDVKQDYQATEFRMAADDTLLLVTDGVTEARRVNPAGQKGFLGYDGLVNLALKAYHADRCPERIAQAVLTGAAGFAGGTLSDDAYILTAVWH